MAGSLMLPLLVLFATTTVVITSATATPTLLSERGLPILHLQETHHGNDFCIGFPSIGEASLSLVISTREQTPVRFVITFDQLNAINGTVHNTATVNISSMLTVSPTEPPDFPNYNGISLRTINSTQLISVVAVIKTDRSTNSFLIFPIREYSTSITRYQYAHFSYSDVPAAAHSMFYMATCDANEIVPFVQAPPTLTGVVPVKEIYRLAIDSREVVEDHPTPLRRLTQYEIFRFELAGVDIAGIFGWSDKPFGFFSTLICGTTEDCNDAVIQVPPAYTWGYMFLLVPPVFNSEYTIRILPRYGNTTVTWSCSNESALDNGTETIGLDGITVTVAEGSTCVIEAGRPVGVVQYVEGYSDLLWVASVSQYLSSHLFTTIDGAGVYDIVSVTVLSQCFNTSYIIIDGSPLDLNDTNWSPIYCTDLTTVCGYGINAEINKGTHVVEHLTPSCYLNALVCGWETGKGYAYPAGYGMNPIGVPIISFVKTQYNVPENISDVVIDVSRSGDILKEVSVTIQVRSLDTTPVSQDFIVAEGVAVFRTGQTVSSVTLIINDDLRVETTERFLLVASLNSNEGNAISIINQAEFSIQDNDNLVIGFDRTFMTVSEELRDFNIHLQSNIPLQDSGATVRITTINGTARDPSDYMRIDDIISLQPGQSSWDITIVIMDDNVAELNETFTVQFEIISSAVTPTIVNRSVLFTITDVDGIGVRFTEPIYTFIEREEVETVTVEVVSGGNDFPLDVIVSTYDITATAYTDYTPINQLRLVINPQETSKSFNVSIHDDDGLENIETFSLNLTTSFPDRVQLISNSTVAISNDDSVSVSLDTNDVPIEEDDVMVMLTVVLTNGSAFRDFLIHVSTFPQQSNDYVPIDRDFVFPANSTNLTIPVTIINDDIVEESSEAFTVSIAPSPRDSAFVSVGGRQQTRITIQEDDRAFVTIDGNITYVVREGEGPLMIRLIKFGVTDTSVGVAIRPDFIDEGTAELNVDYRLNQPIIVFGANETVKNYSLEIVTNPELESTETINLGLDPATTNVNVDFNHFVTVTILDLTTTIIGFNSSTFTAVEGSRAQIFISISGSTQNESDVIISTRVGTASGTDFQNITDQQITIPAGVNHFVYSFDIQEDEVFEGTEHFTVFIRKIENSQIVIGDISTATVVIKDNDNITLQLRDENILVNENDMQAVVTIEKIGLSDIDIPIKLEFTDGTANGGFVDYISIPIMSNLASKDSSINITLAIINDDVVELSQENFTVTLLPDTSVEGIIISRNTTNIIIQDDDFAEVYFNSSEFVASENSVEVTVIWSIPSDIELSVQIVTSDGTATSPGDYTAVMRSLTIPASPPLVTRVLINITSDNLFEGTEVFYVNLTRPSYGVILRDRSRRAAIVIPETEQILFNFQKPAEQVFENGLFVAFVLRRVVGMNEMPIYFNFTTLDMTAKAGEDFNATSIIVEFLPSDFIKTINVPLIDDDVSETIEQFTVKIQSIINYSEASFLLFNDVTTVDIVDDEGTLIGFKRTMYTVDEGSSIMIDVVQNGAVNGTGEVRVSTNNGQALAGQDFNAVLETLSFSETITRQIITLKTIFDDLFELNESLSIVLSLSSNQQGVKTFNNTATVTIKDLNVLVLSGGSVSVSRNDGIATVCLTAVPAIPFNIMLQTMFTSALLQPATGGVDYNDTTLTLSLNEGQVVVCFNVIVFGNNQTEREEHACVSLTHPSGQVKVNASMTTQYCPPNYVTITIIKDSPIRTTQPLCTIEDGMVVTPFPELQSPSLPYSYSSTCEHIVLRRCNLTSVVTVTIDYNQNDSTLGRIGVQSHDGYIIVSNNLTVDVRNLGDSMALDSDTVLFNKEDIIITQAKETVVLNLNSSGIVLTVTLAANNTKRLIVNATDSKIDTICGLCGTLNGSLLYSDRETKVTMRNRKVLDSFAKSWLVNPNENIVGVSREDCSTLGNDSVVGDPLFSIPLYITNSTLHGTFLCYELRGVSGEVFNLISDHCVSVNALYAAMNIPSEGNIITSIGIRAVDANGRCVSIAVGLENGCNPLVNGAEMLHYDKSHVSVTKHMSRVRVSVPNCENEQLVMWIMCQRINGQSLIDFVISRGVNLSPTSHGLIGQFWNIPVNISPYHAQLSDEVRNDYDPDKLYLVSVFPVGQAPRRFIGELYHRSWDRSLKSCVYVGSSQGGQLRDIDGPHDTVIEGVYQDYIMSDGLMGTEFKYRQFQSSYCNQ